MTRKAAQSFVLYFARMMTLRSAALCLRSVLNGQERWEKALIAVISISLKTSDRNTMKNQMVNSRFFITRNKTCLMNHAFDGLFSLTKWLID